MTAKGQTVCTPYFHSLLCVSVQCLPLGLKDLGVGLEEVFALHSLLARHGPNHDADINVAEGHSRVRSRGHLCIREGEELGHGHVQGGRPHP